MSQDMWIVDILGIRMNPKISYCLSLRLALPNRYNSIYPQQWQQSDCKSITKSSMKHSFTSNSQKHSKPARLGLGSTESLKLCIYPRQMKELQTTDSWRIKVAKLR